MTARDRDPLAEADAAVDQARAHLDAVARRVADGEDGASARTLAEYQLQTALRRRDALAAAHQDGEGYR